LGGSIVNTGGKSSGACTQPVPLLQESAVHALLSSQFGAGPAVQAPA
jgi:hypothetical protein